MEWINIKDGAPPLTGETPETDGWYVGLHFKPSVDSGGKWRISLDFGSPIPSLKFWARLPKFPPPVNASALPLSR